MVDHSGLAYRMLCRKYGATLIYTQMFHARMFVESEEYRKINFQTCYEDRPLIVQFCGLFSYFFSFFSFLFCFLVLIVILIRK